MKLTCAVCQTVYETCDRKSRFCSRACYGNSMREFIERPCQACGTMFVPTKHDRKYCSHACYTSVPKDCITVTCVVCATVFKTSHRRRKFCSQQCFGQDKRGKPAWNAGIKTGHAPWLGKVRSPETVEKIRQAHLGRTVPQEVRDKIRLTSLGRSRGGVSSIALIVRGMTEYKNWRRAVFERDAYTCQDCDATKVYLNADHHRVSFATLLRQHKITSTIEAAACSALWDISNGRTLCLDCHKKTPTFGNPKSARDALAARHQDVR